jgi:hypothetical protein
MLQIRKKNTLRWSTIVAVFALFSASGVFAEEDPTDAFQSATELYEQGDIDGAIEEAEWGLELLRQLKRGATATHFLDEINGYVATPLETNSAMGMTVMERRYTKGGNTITVTLTGGANTALGGLGALASMGMMGAGEKVRIQRRTGTAIAESGENRIMFGLKEAGMLNFESRDVSMDELKAFAGEFPIAELDDSSSGG